MNSFRYNLVITRKRRNYTQRQMADFIGVTESCYAHWEQGRNEPSIDFIIRICKVLQVSADEILGVNEN